MAQANGTALTNSVGTPLGADALNSYAAGRRANPGGRTAPAGVAVLASFTVRPAQLVAPGFESGLVHPAAMSSARFAEFVGPNPLDLTPATELGPMVARFCFRAAEAAPLSPGHFAKSALLVAFR